MKKTNSQIDEFKELFDLPHIASLPAAAKILYGIMQNAECDEKIKQECYNLLIDTICWRVRNLCAIGVISDFARSFKVHFDLSHEYSVSVMEFVRKVLNEPQVVESFSNASILDSRSYFVSMASIGVEKFFYEENVLQILSERTKRLIFFIFGHHYAMLRDVEIQKKWIKSYIKYRGIEPAFGIRYITKDALNSLPLEISFAFVKKAINFLSPNLMTHFDLETIKKIVLTHIVVHGKDKDSTYMLKLLEEYHTIFA